MRGEEEVGGDSLERDGDVSEGLVTEGVSDLLPHQAGVQQLPLPVGQVVLEIHVTGSVGDVDLTKHDSQFMEISASRHPFSRIM